MSQSDLAEKLGLKLMQIQRYEESRYKGVNLGRLIEIADLLNVDTSGLLGTAEVKGNIIFFTEKH